MNFSSSTLEFHEMAIPNEAQRRHKIHKGTGCRHKILCVKITKKTEHLDLQTIKK